MNNAKLAQHFDNARLLVSRAEDRIRNRIARGNLIESELLKVVVEESARVVLEMSRVVDVWREGR